MRVSQVVIGLALTLSSTFAFAIGERTVPFDGGLRGHLQRAHLAKKVVVTTVHRLGGVSTWTDEYRAKKGVLLLRRTTDHIVYEDGSSDTFRYKHD